MNDEKPGFFSTEFWNGVGVIAAIPTMTLAAISMAAGAPEAAIGIGIAVAGSSVALAFYGVGYAKERTEAKKNGGGQ